MLTRIIRPAHPRVGTYPTAHPTLAAPPFWFWSLGLSLLLAVIFLWPLPIHLHTHTLDTGDALHLAWTVRSTQATLLGQAAPFSALAGYPYTNALLLNPPLYTMALLGLPLYMIGWSASAVYSGLVLLSFGLSCWAATLLGRQLSGSVGAGLVAGLTYAFCDVRLAHLVHLNLLSGFWSILLLVLVVDAWRQPLRTRRGYVALSIATGLLAAAQALSDSYNAIYLVAMIGLLGGSWAINIVWRAIHGQQGVNTELRSIGALAMGGFLALLIVAPVLRPTMVAWQELGVTRQWADHELFAATLGNYLQQHHARSLYNLEPLLLQLPQADPTEQRLWPGAMTLILGALGLLAGARRIRWGLAALALLALMLSFGPRLELAGQQISLPYYRWLFDHAPLFSAARVPARWALLLQLALAMLAALGATRILVGARHMWGQPGLWLVTLALIAITAADVWPARIPKSRDVVGEPTPTVYRVLASSPEGAVLEWPMVNSSPTLAHRYEYYTLAHGKPIVNAASSAPPPRYAEIVAALQSFPSTTTTQLLHDIGVRYVVVNRWEIGTWGELAPRLEAAPGLYLIGEYDDGRHQLYAVLENQPPTHAALAALTANASEISLDLHVAAPLWLDTPTTLYQRDRERELELRHPDGRVSSVRLTLPPLLLPGEYHWNLPTDALGAVELRLGTHVIPLISLPILTDNGAKIYIAASPLPTQIAPGDTLPCLAQTGQSIGTDLILASALVDNSWNIALKQDHRLLAPSSTLACNLTLPTDLPPGEYFLALGIYDPTASAFVPIIGTDKVESSGMWRVPQTIRVH